MANGDLMWQIDSVSARTATSNTTDIGTSTLKFKDGYFAGVGNFGTLNAGASILSSVTTTSSGTFSNVVAGASIVTSLTATSYLAGGLSATYVGIASNNIASVGTAVILSASTAGSVSAGFLTFIFIGGTSAFVPFFLSTST